MTLNSTLLLLPFLLLFAIVYANFGNSINRLGICLPRLFLFSKTKQKKTRIKSSILGTIVALYTSTQLIRIFIDFESPKLL
jgi:TRAP-type uncharacterized transport system fused permease subunit